MPQPNLIDNPEYATLFKKVFKKKEVGTSELLGDERNYVKRKNILRKMKNLENCGIVHIETSIARRNRGRQENRYSIDYQGLANYFAKFLYKKLCYIGIDGEREFIVGRFSGEEIKQFERYLKHYLNALKVQKQNTIRKMFYQIMITSCVFDVHPKLSDGFSKVHSIIKNSLALDRYDQLRKEIPVVIEVVLKNPEEK